MRNAELNLKGDPVVEKTTALLPRVLLWGDISEQAFHWSLVGSSEAYCTEMKGDRYLNEC